MKVDTEASAFDLQAFGQLAGRELGLYFTWAKSPGGTASQPNILNVSRLEGNPVGPAEPMLYRLNERKAWTVGAEYSLIPYKLHLGAAYRRAKTGGDFSAYNGANGTSPAITSGTNPSDNAITVTAVYNLNQNIEFHINQSFYSGTLYDTPQSTGDRLTTIMLEASW
jgi:predicted porin